MGQRADKSAVRAINRRLRGMDGYYRAWVAMGDVVYVDELEHGKYPHRGRRKRPHPTSTPLPPLRDSHWRSSGSILEHGFRLLVYYSVVLKTRKKGRGVFYDPPSWRASVLGSA